MVGGGRPTGARRAVPADRLPVTGASESQARELLAVATEVKTAIVMQRWSIGPTRRDPIQRADATCERP